jgi:hypothetical protein
MPPPSPQPASVLASPRSALVLAAFALVLCVYNVQLGAVQLWGDEADTGNFARSVLAHGVPKAIVGRNVMAYGDCYQLSANLLSRRLPWLQYYMGAASTALFGDDAAGLRRLFSWLGALAFFPLWALLRTRIAWAPLGAAALLLQPQTVLFARQARYYPLVVLLFSTWLWNMVRAPNDRRHGLAISVACSVLLFHSHPIAALGACVAFCAHAAWLDRERLRESVVASSLGFASWALWYLALPELASATESPLALMQQDFAAWLLQIGTGTLAGIRDLDRVGCLGLLAWALLLAYTLLARTGAQLRAALRGPAAIVLFLMLSQLPLGAAVVGVETQDDLAVLRYMPHLSALSLLPLMLASHAALRSRLACSGFVLLFTLSNLGALTFWSQPAQLPAVPTSWWPAVYGELLQPPHDDLQDLVQSVRSSAATANAAPLLAVVPSYWTDVFVYSLGAHFRLVPDTLPGSVCSQTLAAALGTSHWEGLHARAQAGIFFGRLAHTPPGYDASFLPLHRDALDGARPELTRHRFASQTPSTELTILRAHGP